MPLWVPPIKQNDMQNMVHIKYDSVAGITKNTRMYMIYVCSYYYVVIN